MPPSTPAPAPTCDHCGYDLTGIAPEDAASPQTLKCPECGKQSDTNRVPAPESPWWRFPLAVIVGSGTLAATYLLLAFNLLSFRGRSGVSVSTIGVVVALPILLGGAVSLAIVWRDRLAHMRWTAQHQGVPVRHWWPLVVDFVSYCIMDIAVAGGVAVLLAYLAA